MTREDITHAEKNLLEALAAGLAKAAATKRKAAQQVEVGQDKAGRAVMAYSPGSVIQNRIADALEGMASDIAAELNGQPEQAA